MFEGDLLEECLIGSEEFSLISFFSSFSEFLLMVRDF